MEPGIGRVIGQGFQAANRSWTGIGFFIGAWAALIVAVGLIVVISGVPRDLFRQAGGTEVLETPLGTVESPIALDVEEAEAQAEEADAQAEEQVRLMEEWFTRAWPILLVGVLLLIAASLWLQGGQIGYLAQIVRKQQSKVSAFWIVGTQAFGRLLGAWLIALLAVGVLAVLFGLIVALFGLLGNAAPAWLLIMLGLVMGLGVLAGLTWIGIKLLFWYIAIVIDGVGPIAGLKASFSATRGRWWKALGLAVVLGLIGYAVGLAFNLLGRLVGIIGGAGGGVLGLIVMLANIVVSLYVGFVVRAAFIRFYEDTKTQVAEASPAGGQPPLPTSPTPSS